MAKTSPIPNNETEEKSDFQQLYDIDISPFVETLSISGREMDYLEWATAWRLAKEFDPEAKFQIHWSPNAEPYYKTGLGYFVFCSVSLRGITENDVYAIDTKDLPNASDVSNAHQRCLVKCLGRHGLGLKLWEKRKREKLHAEEPAPKSNQSSWHVPSSSEFRFTFGKFKDKTFSEIKPEELTGYMAWLKSQPDQQKNAWIFTSYELWKKAGRLTGETPPPPGDADLPF